VSGRRDIASADGGKFLHVCGICVKKLKVMESFTAEQIEEMRRWMSEVQSIGEFQTKLNETFHTHLTFLQTRLLMNDFGLELKPKAEEKPPAHSSVADNESARAQALEGEMMNGVQVTVDPVTRPGMFANGSVVFTDGVQATWALDQLGRVQLHPSQVGYQPSESDLAAFRTALQQKL
jgi:hypothetical protein